MQPDSRSPEPTTVTELAASLEPRAPAEPSAAPLRDARGIAARIAGDERAADEARERYRRDGLPELEPSSLSDILHPDERLHAVHRLAMLERGWSPEADVTVHDEQPLGGTLYVTSRRLIHRGTTDASWPFTDIDEMAVALERLLLVRLRDGSDLAIEVDQPRLLRVQLATGLAAARAGEPATGAPVLQPIPIESATPELSG